jgi:D-apionolactonase
VTALKAGPLRAVYSQGELRDVCWNDQPLLSRLYAAVRDASWATLEGTVVEEQIAPERITFTMRHTHVIWDGTIELLPEGGLTFTFAGKVVQEFRRNRIGFCLLHPLSVQGSLCQLEHTDGTRSEAAFPVRVSPDQPVGAFARMQALTQTLPDGSRVRFGFAGETFELEDQRNWTDASYKTFCTPLSLPYPVTVRVGERLWQQVTISGQLPTAQTALHTLDSLSSHEAVSPQPREARSIRVDLFGNLGDQLRLIRADTLAQQRGCGLEIALIGCPKVGTYVQAKSPVIRWLVLPATEQVNTAPDHEPLLLAAQSLRKIAPVFAGTDSDFLFLNRFPPPLELCDGLTFAINPQVHAFDEASIEGTLASYPAILATAQELAQGKPVIVSPLTLSPRWNPYASVPSRRDIRLPRDPRETGEFGRRWLARAAQALLGARAASVTLETTFE